jgi:hypothetical protein
MLFAMAGALSLAGLTIGVVPGPILPPSAADVSLDVDAEQDGYVITYLIRFENVGRVSVTVDLWDQIPFGTMYLGDPKEITAGVWNRTFPSVAPGAYNVTVAVLLPSLAADGDHVVNVVTMAYASQGASVFRTYEHESVVRFATVPPATDPAAPPSTPLWVMAAPPAAAGTAMVGLAAYRRTRRPKIEQVFLMHTSGMLIQHWAVGESPVRDIDILSAMFVVLKDFVRDSFREKEGGLSELQFGDSHMLMAEGQHSILATVVSGGRLNGLPGQIQEAVRDFEARNGGSLPDWSGHLDALDGAGDVIDNLVRGRYGHLRRST